MTTAAFLQCIDDACGATYDMTETFIACRRCGSLLDVQYDWDRAPVPRSLRTFESRRDSLDRLDFSGVWRFRELLGFHADPAQIHSVGEGRTILQSADGLARELGMPKGTLHLQYEGFNPSGSFKDSGMTAAFTHARSVGARTVACASTGNTSASMALYAAGAGLKAVVLVGGGRIARGKLSQALDHGALTLQVKGDFDKCLSRLGELAGSRPELGLYLMNSVNPFRLEGQKTIIYRILEARGWSVPDWILLPGGNLGNTAAFGKALSELRHLGLIDRLPRLAVIQAEGANPLHRLVNDHGLRWNGGRYDRALVSSLYAADAEAGRSPHTVASAIEIGRPVNLPRALRALEVTEGVVRQASDAEILDGRAQVGRFGFGCEPASGATIAGLSRLLADGTIASGQQVVCILTGHALEDSGATVSYHTASPVARYANPTVPVEDDLDSIMEQIA